MALQLKYNLKDEINLLIEKKQILCVSILNEQQTSN